VGARAHPICLVFGFGWTRMGALDELWDLPGGGQSNPIAPLGSETEVSVFAGVAQKVDQQRDVLSAISLDLVHATLLPPGQ
jgi:hypothetical protein